MTVKNVETVKQLHDSLMGIVNQQVELALKLIAIIDKSPHEVEKLIALYGLERSDI